MAERCGWVGQDPLYIHYHDTEWGVPQYDSRVLWETLVLECFQGGLSESLFKNSGSVPIALP